MKKVTFILLLSLCSLLLLGSCTTMAAKREQSLILQAEALLLLDEKAYGQAVTLLEEAVRLSPKESEGRYNLVLALLANGEFDEAITLSEESFALFPAHLEFLLAKAYALREKGESKSAFAVYESILRLDRGNFALHATLMELALAMNQTTFARETALYLLSVHKEEARALQVLATMEGEGSWYAAAAPLMKEASGQDPELLPEQSI